MFRAIIAAAFLLAACTPPPAKAPPAPDVGNAVGRLHHYVRSNQDGTHAEQIYVYREAADRVAVSKMVDPCTNAAYVTGAFDLAANEPLQLVGGRLTRELTQNPFATLTLDPAARTLTTHVDTEAGDIDEVLEDVAAPWRIYDFDLADITTLMEGRAAPREDFAFNLAIAWPAGDPPFVRMLGEARAAYAGEEERAGHASVRYDLTGALNGQLWLDAAEGYVVEARFAEPNHPGYADFLLVLQSVTEAPAGPDAWRAVLAAHWEGCPAED